MRQFSLVPPLLVALQLFLAVGQARKARLTLTLGGGSGAGKRFGKWLKPGGPGPLQTDYMEGFYNPFWYGGPIDGGDLYDGPFGGFAPSPFAKPKLFKTNLQIQKLPMMMMTLMGPAGMMTPPMPPPPPPMMGGMMAPGMMGITGMSPMMGGMMGSGMTGMAGMPPMMGGMAMDPGMMGMAGGAPMMMPAAMMMAGMDMTMTPVITPNGMMMMPTLNRMDPTDPPTTDAPTAAPPPPSPVVKTNVHVHNLVVPAPYDEPYAEPYDSDDDDGYYR